MTDVIHETYLPFSSERLAEHFALASGPVRDRDVYVNYYDQWAKRHQAWTARGTGAPAERTGPQAGDVRIEKDERFWVASAMLHLAHSPNPVGAFAALLRTAIGEITPLDGFDTWEAALGTTPKVYFEANLPAPKGYQTSLSEHLSQRILDPTALRAAQGKKRLEGSTKVDAVLIAPDTGFSVLFEAKVLSDVSTKVSYDVTRNQLARLIDVSLETGRHADQNLAARDPKRTCVVLLTPEIFKTDRTTRLYGFLYDEYRNNPETLKRHLRHRDDAALAAAAGRLGWATWDDVNVIVPGALGWLTGPQAAEPSVES